MKEIVQCLCKEVNDLKTIGKSWPNRNKNNKSCCWTHGRAEGHKDDVVLDNRIGRSDRFCKELWWVQLVSSGICETLESNNIGFEAPLKYTHPYFHPLRVKPSTVPSDDLNIYHLLMVIHFQYVDLWKMCNFWVVAKEFLLMFASSLANWWTEFSCSKS